MEIEVNAASGNSIIVVVGLPDTTVEASKDRVTTAIAKNDRLTPSGPSAFACIHRGAKLSRPWLTPQTILARLAARRNFAL